MKFLVEIYEPSVDPGGYQDVFEIDSCCRNCASDSALKLAYKKYPNNKGLEVAAIITKAAYQFLTRCKI